MAYKHSPYAMKKLTFMMLLAAFFTLCVTSCSKDDDDSFAYPMEQLYGKWKAVEIKVDGRWYDVTKYPYTRFGMDITFYENGKFYVNDPFCVEHTNTAWSYSEFSGQIKSMWAYWR